MGKRFLLLALSLTIVFSVLCKPVFADWLNASQSILNVVKDAKGSNNESSGSNSNKSSKPRKSNPNDPELKIVYGAPELAKLQKECEALIQDAPTGGKSITFQQLQNILSPYRKSMGTGNTDYRKTMNMTQFEKDAQKNWVATANLSITENWLNGTNQKSEILHIKNQREPYKEGAVECELRKEDADFHYTYRWYKTATTGFVYKKPKKSTAKTPEKHTPASPHEKPKMPDMKVTLYPDKTVAGQLCKVYSYGMNENTDTGMYFWFSTVKGFDILNASITTITRDSGAPSATNAYAMFTYENKKISKDAAFFDPSKQGVTQWVEKSGNPPSMSGMSGMPGMPIIPSMFGF